MTARLLLIEDHPIVRDALSVALAEIDPARYQPDLAGGLAEGLERLRAGGIDLVLLDLALPDADGLDALARLRAAHPDVPVAILSGATDRQTILACLDAGAVGFVPKTAPREVLAGALRLMSDGGKYVPPEALAGVDFGGVHAARVLSAGAARPFPPYGALPGAPARAAPDNAAAASGPPDLGLTARQEDVLRLILDGLPNKLICRQLRLAEGTVKVHVSAVLRALGVRSRTQAVVAASRLGLRFGERRGVRGI